MKLSILFLRVLIGLMTYKHTYLITILTFLLFPLQFLLAESKQAEQRISPDKRDTNYVFLLMSRAGRMANTNLDSMRIFINEIYLLSDSLGYKNGIGIGHFMTGLSYFVQGKDDSAMSWFQKSLVLFQQTKYPKGLGLAYHNIGRLYSRLAELKKAKEFVTLALNYRKQINEPEAVLSSLTVLGLIARGENNTKLEEYYHNEAFKIAKEMNPPSIGGMAMAISNLALIELERMNYAKAEEYYNESHKLHSILNDLNGVTLALNGLGQVASGRGFYDKAISYGKQALRNSYKTNNTEGVIKNANLLAYSYEKTGNYKEALYYHKIYQIQKDSLNRLQAKQEYLNALSKFEIQQKELQINFLQNENKVNQLKSENKSLQLNILISVSVIFIIIFIGYIIRSKEIKKIEIAQLSEKLQKSFSANLINRQEEERRRIASELHDSLGQNLLIIKNMLDYSIKSNNEKKELETRLQELSNIAMSSIEEIRTITRNLFPYQLNRMGITTAITSMLKNLETSTSIKVNYSIDNLDKIFSKETETHLYRIVQEAMNNVIKHSGAVNVNVKMKLTDMELEMRIIDNGYGFNTEILEGEQANRIGLGILGIKERARITGGTFQIHSEIGKGTSLTVVVPV